MLKKILILSLILLIFSGCLESQHLFEDRGTNIENEAYCTKYCDSVNDLQQFTEIECEEGKCLCRCKLVFWG